jgi:hypothetical protein
VVCYGIAYIAIFYYGATNYSLHYDWSMVPIGEFYEFMEFAGMAFFSLGIPLLTFSLEVTTAFHALRASLDIIHVYYVK